MPRLHIDPSCTRLIECLTRYRYDPAKRDQPIPLKDGHDHACDALRYLILNLDAPSQVRAESYQ